jgi:hypothetical protein
MTSVRVLRHLLAPLVLIALAALIIARNSRAEIPGLFGIQHEVGLH